MTDKHGTVAAITEYARSSLWVLPAVSITLAVVLGVVLSNVDVSEDRFFSQWLFPGGPEGARGILEAIAASVITVTSLVFSLTVVTLQLASSQFSPRLLRTFLRRPGNQIVMSVFLSTFVYALVVLRTIREEGGEPFVPALAVSVGFLLVLASVAALVYFIHHITSEIRADTLMQRAESDTLATIDAVHPRPLDAGATPPTPPEIPPHALPIPATTSGIVQAVTADSLAEAAQTSGTVVVSAVRVGDRVVSDGVLAWAWGAGEAQPEDLTRAVNAAFTIGHERTLQQDVSYGVRQLVDMATKALSTGLNDPTTAIDATGHLSSVLSVLARRHIADIACHDDEGRLLAYVHRLTYTDYLALACGPIRRYGSTDPDVMLALVHLLRETGAAAVLPGQVTAVRHELGLVLEAAEHNVAQEADVERVRAACRQTEAMLDGVRLRSTQPQPGAGT
ncbi:MAG TPA: DUF2254 domain-containing protein [Egibacteraceae bacterium]|nr:DUF2254 domain-containing protein [Egibacteraceae bacterium]